MKTVKWQVKKSWDLYKDHPGVQTDYWFLHDWLNIGKCFPGVHKWYFFNIEYHGGEYAYSGFKRFKWDSGTKYFRLDIGKWYLTISRPNANHYKSVDVLEVIE